MAQIIRPAVPTDLPRLTDIYNQAIRAGTCTGDTEEFTEVQRLPWLQEHLDPAYPLFVCELDGTVAGYVYLTPYRKGRKALHSTVEISYYLDFRFHRRGIGSQLVEYAVEAARALGYRKLMAILLSCNAASQGLLKKHGFVQWGLLPDVAELHGQFYSHLYFGLDL